MQLVFLKTHFLEVIRLISFVCTLPENRNDVGMVPFPSKGPVWGPCGARVGPISHSYG